jgi:16S rRNA (uracil1498-N3)-methyltransferase
MQFVYHPQAGEALLNVDVRAYDHLFKVRRIGVGTTLWWRNLQDDDVYEYRIVSIGKKEAALELIDRKNIPIVPTKNLHVMWSIIDPKIIEKSLPMLNELGVERITFFYAAFSQQQFKLDFERMERILINSSQQCGRSRLMRLECLPSLQALIQAYPDATVLDFSEQKLSSHNDIEKIIIGPEGGFSEKERSMLAKNAVAGLACSTILRSETAAIAAASKILA